MSVHKIVNPETLMDYIECKTDEEVTGIDENSADSILLGNAWFKDSRNKT